MRTRHVIDSMGGLCIIGGLALLLVFSGCSSGAELKKLPVGSVMPNFTLKDFTGKEHSLEQLKGKIVVLDFCSHKCPWSRGADKTLPELAKTYGEKDVVFLGIDSHKSTPPEEIKEYAAEQKILHPILKDVENQYADAVGATRTPEFYILDKELKLAYHGAFDDRKAPDKPGENNHVRNALDDLLAGQPVKNPKVDAWGCTIKRAR